MKLTPQEIKIQSNFEPGNISKDGFLGNDTRHIHDIIKADQLILDQFGITKEDIADKLQYFIDQGKKYLEGEVDLEEYTLKVIWTRGKIPCPFNDHTMHDKIIVHVFYKPLNKEIKYSQLNVHMIREYGFFEGKGSIFRLEPEELIKILDLT